MFITYKERNKLLSELGFKDYRDYLSSEWWKTIRRIILKRDAFSCRGCGKHQCNEVHHFTYNKSSLLGAAPECLITLCRDCHQQIEFEGSRKRSLKDVQKKTLELVVRTELNKGVSNPKVGRWFRNQHQANKPILSEIRKELRCIAAKAAGKEQKT